MYKHYFFLLVAICISSPLFAQVTTVSGTVIDAESKEPLIFANVYFNGTSIGVNTEIDGTFTLSSEKATDTLVVDYLGYEPFYQKIEIGKEQTFNIELGTGAVTLETAVITQEKEKYRNKDNPAVALIKNVIEQKDNNDINRSDNYGYEEYEKTLLGLSNLTEKFKKRKIFRKLQFLFDQLDTTSISGQEMLPVYIKEVLSDVYYDKNRKKKDITVMADTTVSFEGYGDQDGFEQYLQNLYQNIDLTENNITILQQQFLSPIANNSYNFYKFYIQDTVQIDETPCVKLFFAPRNKLDILFQGFMYVAYEDNYNVKEVDMSINSNINLNWVKTLQIVQEFEKMDNGKYIQIKDRFAADFGLSKNGMGIYGDKTVTRQNIGINQPKADPEALKEKAELVSVYGVDWGSVRHQELSIAEQATYQKIDSLQGTKVFKRVMGIATIALSGYTKVSPYFEVGPVNTFYSFNQIEGFRPRLGGRTTPSFSDRLEIETYGAYGFRDEEFKGYLGLSYSLNNKNVHKFPVRRLLVSAQRETSIPGLKLQFIQEDNVLLSIKRGTNDKYVFNNNYKLEYLNEFENSFSFSVGLNKWTHRPIGGLNYPISNAPDGDFIEELNTTEVNLTLRWAPNEQFYQGKTYRKPIINKFPIFTLRYNRGIKGFWDAEYDYDNISLNIYKRFFLNRLGYSDVRLEGGIINGQVPHPFLFVATGNQTYAYQRFGFNLMNFLEFVSDEYASFNLDHNFNGLFLNRIPLVKKLKLREVFNVRMLVGRVSDDNNPELQTGLIDFPTNKDGEQTTFQLGKEPYIEGSVGVANVLKFFRIDLVRRFNYLDQPEAVEWGIRARFKIYL